MSISQYRSMLDRAMASGAILRMHYGNGKGETSWRDIQPQEWETWEGPDQFAAYCYHRQEVRHFLVSRILALEEKASPSPARPQPTSGASSGPASSAGNLEAKRQRFNFLDQCDSFGMSPPEVEEYRRLKQELFGRPANKSEPAKPSMAATPSPPQPSPAPAGLKPIARKPQPVTAPPGPRLTQVASGDQWNRLVRYYAECLSRENRQQHRLRDFTKAAYPLPLEKAQTVRFIEGQDALEFAVADPRNQALLQFLKVEKVRGERQLCLGYLWFTTSTNEHAPLLVAQVASKSDSKAMVLEMDDYEASTAALDSLGLTEEEIEAVLDECARLTPASGETRLVALQRHLIGRLSDLLGQSIPLTPWKGGSALLAGTLVDVAALFWVQQQTATANLVAELADLSDPAHWNTAPTTVKQLLGGVPSHAYPHPPDLVSDPAIYVTALNDDQRQAVAAGLVEPVTVVTGPPGTGKSQTILNLIAQAVMRGQTVLFASRNNQAVDVVMDRLAGEMRLEGAVRTGTKERRLAAAQRMADTLQRVKMNARRPGTAALREQYGQLRQELFRAERDLETVRRLGGLEQSYSAECDDLRAQLKSRAKVVEENAPGFNKDEYDHLSDVLARLRNTALALQDGLGRLESEVDQLIRRNPAGLVVLIKLREFEDQWGSFGDRFLNPSDLGNYQRLQEYLETWLKLLKALELQQIVTGQRREFRAGMAVYEQERAGLALETAAAVDALVSGRATVDSQAAAASMAALQPAVDSLARYQPNWWQRLLAGLGLRNRVRDFAEKAQAISATVGGQWVWPAKPALADKDMVLRIWGQLAEAVRVAGVRSRLAQMEQALGLAQAQLDEARAALPEALGADVDKVEIPVEAASPLRSEISSLLTRLREALAPRSELVVRVNAKIDQNGDHLGILDAFKKTPAGADESLWRLKEDAGPGTLVRHLNRWREVVALWTARALHKQAMSEAKRLPSEVAALQIVKGLADKLFATGTEYLRSVWLERVKNLPSKVVQDASHYIAAMRQLADIRWEEPFDRAAWRDLKMAESEHLPDALRVFPVWATTNLSAKTNLPLTAGLFDLVVIDEASQCDVPSALPLLYRGKQAVVVGDPMQLRHVATIFKPSDVEASNHYGIAPSFSYSDQSLYDIASRSTGNRPGAVFLGDHYRSDPHIINFSNEEFYKELRIKTDMSRFGWPDEYLRTGRGLFWVNVAGHADYRPGESASNSAEIRAIQKLLPKLLAHLDGLKMTRASLGIVTPYRPQEKALRSWLYADRDGEAYSEERILAGTAHKFQGSEKDVMIFSPVLAQGLKSSSLSWMDRTANLLNVAITRARTTLIVVGDLEYCLALPATNKYRRLAEYAKRQPSRVVNAVADLPLFKNEPVNIIGKLTDPTNKSATRATLRSLVLSCQTFLWWMDPYISDKIFRFLMDVSQHPDLGITDLRILTLKSQLEASPHDNRPPSLTLAEATAALQALKSRNLPFQLGVLPKEVLPHDRFLYSANYAINMPPFAGAYGEHSHISEYTSTSTRPEFFERLWAKAEKLL